VVKRFHLFGLGAAGSLLLLSPAASASDSMNPALSRLVLDHRCNATNVGDGSYQAYVANLGKPDNIGQFNDGPDRALYFNSTGRDSCVPDNVAFKRLMNQWGFALAPTAMHPARTTGYGGFHFSIEATYTSINNGADYWKLGTEGPRDQSSNKASEINANPPGVISTYSARVRKSFGFGLEVGGQVGFMPSTTILTGGADVRMAIIEGFRTGALGYFPDIAVGAGVRTITGTPEFQLTTVGLDVQLSKPFTIASQSVLTPWVGYQYLWIFGDSGLVDTTPATDAVGYCRYAGTNSPGNADPTKKSGSNQIYDGQPVCAGGSPLDFNNNVVFDNARLERQRIMFGLSYRYEIVEFGAEFITDLVSPSDAQVGGDSTQVPTGPGTSKTVTDKQALAGEPRQWTLVLNLGAAF